MLTRKEMKKYLTLLLVACLTGSQALCQQHANVGVFAGTAFYLGDINPSRLFYRPSLSLGALYRYNINQRYAIRANAYYVALSGSDADFPEIEHPDRPFSPANFSTSLLDVALQVEFNFLPYEPNQKTWDYTPYIATGFAGGMIANSDTDATNFLSIPLGIGVKTTFTKRLSGGLEWSFRKTFSDRIDGYSNYSGVWSVIHNNDWYSILGVFITYKFFNFAGDCPAYE